MSAPSAPNVNTTYLQQGNGQILISWAAVSGATSYKVQRSTDGINFSALATVSGLQYVDSTVNPGTIAGASGTQYWYQVAASNSTGDSTYTPTSPSSVVPVVAGVMSLGQIRLLSQQRADKVNSNYVTLPEWNSFINLAADELYNLITTCKIIRVGENMI